MSASVGVLLNFIYALAQKQMNVSKLNVIFRLRGD